MYFQAFKQRTVVFILFLISAVLFSLPGCEREGQPGDQEEFTFPAKLTADPNPVQVCDGTGLGITTVSWSAEGVPVVQVRIARPDGNLFARGAPQGSAKTGKWVRNGTTVYLLDDASEKVLATLKIVVTNSGCP